MVFIKVDKLLFHTQKMLSYAAWFSLKWRNNYFIQKSAILCSMVFIQVEKTLFHTEKHVIFCSMVPLKWRNNYSIQQKCYFMQHDFH